MRGPFPRSTTALRCFVWVVLLSLACGIREDELECEIAAAHVEGCCPQYSGSFDCSYSYGTCNGRTYESFPPDLQTTRAIQGMPCSEVQEQGFCTAAIEGETFEWQSP